MEFELAEVKKYLENRFQKEMEIEEVKQLAGKASGAEALKQFGYGRPFLVSCRVDDRKEQLVFHRIRTNAFGREREDDRVAAVWLDFKTFNRLPRHVPAVDMVVRSGEGKMESIHGAEEVLLVTAYRPGRLYADDLMRIRDEGKIQPLDIKRAEKLASYLAEIHQVKHDEPTLWRRRLRDLVGHGEGIMGLTDSYPPNLPYITDRELRSIEEMANRWRWKLKPFANRLHQVHGDFHPFNIIFEEEDEFWVLDRSRGEWGEAADDVSCMTINYIFFSLQRFGQLDGPFRELHDAFWANYLTLRLDEQLQSVIQPWFAWRALVLASPIWYPDISEDVRLKLLRFARTVLSAKRYNYRKVNQYIGIS
jgi:aminoglycoside phosphotransferase (APT) family kinase protein